MIQSRRELAQAAAARAMKVRDRANYSLHSAINVYDLCERLGVSVFFHDIPSMEGLYMPEARPRPVIIISSLRPAGRRAMTCGHELGHHQFQHGRQWDELVEDRDQSRRFDPDEFQADVFSACLQMPRSGVSHAFATRGLNPEKCRAEEIFMLAGLFGVSYAAFVTHLERTLDLIGMKRASRLAAKKPHELRETLLGRPCPQNLFVVDLFWEDRAVDAEVGDSLIFPGQVSLEGQSAEIEVSTECRVLLRAVRPGISRANHPTGWCVFIRVAPKNYVGRAPLRFDEDICNDP